MKGRIIFRRMYLIGNDETAYDYKTFVGDFPDDFGGEPARMYECLGIEWEEEGNRG